MDCIFLRELRLDAWIGLHRYEPSTKPCFSGYGASY
jgi:hypothetical protein